MHQVSAKQEHKELFWFHFNVQSNKLRNQYFQLYTSQ